VEFIRRKVEFWRRIVEEAIAKAIIPNYPMLKNMSRKAA
jgi:hypothetical protein